jgi:uncharacterized protein (TIGR02001 family)
MQNYCKTIGAMAAASALVAGTASAEVEYEIHTGYTSEYIWRGINLGQDLVEVGVDVATEVNGFGLSAGAWYASFDAPTGFGVPFSNANANELDLYAEVNRDLGFATVAVGYIYYNFPQGVANKNLVPVDDAQEVYFSIARDFSGLETSLTYFWDIETDNDGYMEAAASYGFELNECLTLSTGATLGYLAEEGDFTHLTAKVALDYAFTQTATLSPFIGHSWTLSEGGRMHNGTSAYIGAKNQLFGGAMLSVSF